MKKFLTIVAVVLFVFGFSGCEEKSDMEKAQDSISKAVDDTKKAAQDLKY